LSKKKGLKSLNYQVSVDCNHVTE